MRAVTKERFDRLVGSISNQDLDAVESALRAVLELP
jgi:hypothetical protein